MRRSLRLAFAALTVALIAGAPFAHAGTTTIAAANDDYDEPPAFAQRAYSTALRLTSSPATRSASQEHFAPVRFVKQAGVAAKASPPSGAPYGPFHRLESATQTPDVARMQQQSGEVWGRAPFGSDIPAVQAYTGPLPAGARGIEFITDVAPDVGTPPGRVMWRGPRPGVRVEGDLAKIRCTVTVNTQC